jgi:hypothetical protein
MVDESVTSRVSRIKRKQSATSWAQDDIGEFAEPKVAIK